jgi:hypothetical protein
MKAPVPGVQALVRAYANLTPVKMSLPRAERAWNWSDRCGHRILGFAHIGGRRIIGCRYLLGEDFQTDRRYGSVTLVNPFRTDPDQFFVR